jgi:DNA-binding PadR family transcriptional regulator
MKKTTDANDTSGLVSDFSRFYILMIIFETPRHGYEIITEFNKRVGKKISAGLVYPFLQKLEDNNIIEFTSEMVGKKERKIYSLTEKGKEFTGKLFSRFSNIVSTALEPSMDVCAHCGCKVYEGAHIEEIDGVETTFCCIHCASHFKHERMEV